MQELNFTELLQIWQQFVVIRKHEYFEFTNSVFLYYGKDITCSVDCVGNCTEVPFSDICVADGAINQYCGLCYGSQLNMVPLCLSLDKWQAWGRAGEQNLVCLVEMAPPVVLLPPPGTLPSPALWSHSARPGAPATFRIILKSLLGLWNAFK